jgi:hypothetical protein
VYIELSLIGNTFKSLAMSINLKKKKRKDLARTPLIKIFNNRGPKAEPCGTHDSMNKSMEEFLKVRT